MSRRFFRRLSPDPEKIRASRGLRFLGPLVDRPWLWHVNRRGVALGLACGVFFGFLVPIAQIPCAAVAAVWLRANLPLAVVSTLVTNPFTFPPVYFAAYLVGDMLLGGEGDAAAAAEVASAGAQAAGVLQWLFEAGQPLVVGLVTFAVIGSLAAYFGVHALWRFMVWRQRARRRAGR